MAICLLKTCANKKSYNYLNKVFRFINFSAFFKKPVEESESLSLFHQDILSNKLLDSNKEKIQVFLKALSANLKFKLQERINEEKLENILKYNGLKEISHEDWAELYKNQGIFSPKLTASVYSTLKLYKSKNEEQEGWSWWNMSTKSYLMLFKTKEGGDLKMRMFKNMQDKQILSTILKSSFPGWLPDRLLFSTCLGLSIGSLSSTLLLESLYLPSIAISTTAFTSTTLACFFYSRICNSQLSLLHKQSEILSEKLSSNTESCIDILASKAYEKLYNHLLLLYVALNKSNHLFSTDGKIETGETLRSNLSLWLQRELSVELPVDFDMEFSLDLMHDLGLVRKDGESDVVVMPFESALQTLIQQCPPSRFLSEQSNYVFN